MIDEIRFTRASVEIVTDRNNDPNYIDTNDADVCCLQVSRRSGYKLRGAVWQTQLDTGQQQLCVTMIVFTARQRHSEKRTGLRCGTKVGHQHSMFAV